MQYRPELLKESDRYRGRRRAAAPSRRRYAAVLATAVAGAGVVAVGAGATIGDAKTDHSNAADVSAYTSADGLRADAAERANRAEDRTMNTSITQAPDAWVLPLRDYNLTSRYGMRWGKLHRGLDLAGLPEGTPYMAVRGGKVVQSGWNGGYGNSVIIDHGGGIQTLYGHSSKVLVKVGQEVKAGDVIALLGNTGYSFGTHLHLEVYVDGVAQNPLTWFKKRGVDFELEIEAVYGG
ncbi:M23 family metallopeptidase [Catellatospora methionotrophica]|uniref:M23 family metallopeptidase n=1 Tax=Catellatospora methionotrophica TaxID=121620 RepID=UPI003400C243